MDQDVILTVGNLIAGIGQKEEEEDEEVVDRVVDEADEIHLEEEEKEEPAGIGGLLRGSEVEPELIESEKKKADGTTHRERRKNRVAGENDNA